MCSRFGLWSSGMSLKEDQPLLLSIHSFGSSAEATARGSQQIALALLARGLLCPMRSGSSLLSCVAQGFLLKLLNSAEGFMGGPSMVVHQLFHQVVGRVGDARVQFCDSPVITGQRLKPE